MYQWTPLMHTRAIGAWPALPRQTLSKGKSWHSAHCRRHLNRPARRFEREERVERQQKPHPAKSVGCIRRVHSGARPEFEDPGQEAAQMEQDEQDEGRTDSEGWNYQRKGGNPDLPLPPFMRPAPTLTSKVRQIQEIRHNLVKERAQYYGWQQRGEEQPEPPRRWKQMSPFSKAFSMNPYAFALSAPVRQDSFTNFRLPNSCLVAFKFNDDGKEGALEDMSLFPVSLAAEMIPKKRRGFRMNSAQQETRKAWEEEEAWFRDSGMGTYIIGKKQALDFISEHPVPRVRALGMTRRALTALDRYGLSTIKWREDMPYIVLHYLQSIIAKQLSHLLRTKKAAHSHGTIHAIPADDFKNLRLDHTPDVGCVLRLKPAKANDGGHVDENSKDNPDTMPAMPQLTKTRKRKRREVIHVFHEPDPSDEANLAKDLAKRGTDAGEVDWLHIPDVVEDDEPTKEELASRAPRIRARSTTIHWKIGQWQWQEGFLGELDPLPPPTKPSTTYFATMRYRNRRVPAYNIPELLGEDVAASLTRNTQFADCELVTIGISMATVGLQNSLLKLVAYLGRGKEETAQV